MNWKVLAFALGAALVAVGATMLGPPFLVIAFGAMLIAAAK